MRRDKKSSKQGHTSISFVKVSSLNHEVLDDMMEGGGLVAKATMNTVKINSQ